MRHGSLFNGIGGFQVAADQMEWENVFSSEIDDFCNKVTKFHFPNCIQHKDVRTTDFTIYRGQIDVLTGGFPCQPYSVTGKRKGKEDARHLWPEMRRAVREIQPGWVVGENVRGLINWSDGLVFHEVQADLEAEGYEVFPFLLPAAGVNAPHERYRIWFVAHARSDGHERRRSYENRSAQSESQSERLQWQRLRDDLKRNGIEKNIADTYSAGLEIEPCQPRYNEKERQAIKRDSDGWEVWPTQSPVRNEYDGISRRLVRNIKPEIYGKISEKCGYENMLKMWQSVQQTDIWEKIRRLFPILKKEILLEILQLCTTRRHEQRELSPYCEKSSENIMRTLSKYGEFRRTPRGLELEEQFAEQFTNTLPYVSYEATLAAEKITKELILFGNWQRNESIKAGGNAIVPQVALQIFKAIEQYNRLTH